MLTLHQIEQLEAINEGVVREAYAQAEKRLADTLEAKKAFEQKATTLLSAYVSISLALSGAAVAIFKDPNVLQYRSPFWVASLFLIVGAFCFAGVLWDARYGAAGSDPSMWLNKGTIDGEGSVLLHMLAYVTYHYHARIKTSEEANNRKVWLIRGGIVFGAAAPFILLMLIFWR